METCRARDAENYFERAFEVQEEILGLNHTETRSSQDGLLEAYKHIK